MIAQFKVRNFYSIKSPLELSFLPSSSKVYNEEFLHQVKPGVRLLKLALIYGSNASGKTNVLRALNVFRSLQTVFPEDKLKGLPYVPFMLDDESREEPTFMEMTFYVGGIKYHLSLSFDAGRILREELTVTESLKSALIYKRTYDSNGDKPDILFGTKIKFPKKSKDAIIAGTTNNATVLATVGKINTDLAQLDDVYKFFSSSMASLIEPNMILAPFIKEALAKDGSHTLKPFLLQMLKASDFNICNFDVSQKGETEKELSLLHKTDSGVYGLPEAFESIGTMRFMGMAVLLNLLLFSDKIICIDEVESSLHYELVAYFIKVFLANGEHASQLIMTTHDINLMNEDFLRRDVLWSTDKQDSGETELNRFSELRLHKSGSLYNAYRQGKLGKLPFLGSIYLNLNPADEKSQTN